MSINVTGATTTATDLIDKESPTSEELSVLIETAQSHETASRWAEAELAWREIMRVSEDFWLPYVALAQIYKVVGRRDDLMEAAATAENMIPADNINAKARVSELIEDWVTASARWKIAIEKSPTVWHHYISLSRAHEKSGNLAQCIEVLWKAELIFFEEMSIVSELAQVTQRHEMWAEAERCWRKYLAVNPQDTFTARHLAFVTRKNRSKISPDIKESDLFSYRTFEDAREQMQSMVSYRAFSEPSVLVPELSQPAFCLGVPQDIIDQGINHLKFFFATGAYELTKAQIFRGRLVRCGGFILYGNQMHNNVQEICQHLDEVLTLPIRDLKKRDFDRPVVSLQIGAYPVYGHWIVDVIPQIYAITELGFPIDDLQFVMPDVLPEYHREFLGYCGLNENQISTYDHGRDMLNCAKVIVPTHMNNTRVFMPDFQRSIERFRFNVEVKHGRLRDKSRPKRLFVARQDQSSGRPLVNRDEIVSLARARGFHPILPETLPLIEQWRYFASADIVVGEYGSAMHSTIFCDPGTIVCCLRGTMIGPGYLQSGIGEALSQPTGYIFGATEEEAGIYRYTINKNVFVEWLDSLN